MEICLLVIYFLVVRNFCNVREFFNRLLLMLVISVIVVEIVEFFCGI